MKQGTGTLILSGDNTYSGGTTISAGTLQLGNASATGSIVGNVTNNGTLIFNRSNAYTFAGVISGTGAVTQNGAGITTLAATNTYVGATTVNAGTLLVNGSIQNSSGVTVNAGGTLGGTGTVAATTVNSGGTLAPGNSIGTIAVAGSLTFNNGSVYSIELSPTAADRTQVTNAVTINAGSSVVLTPEVGRYQPRTYTVLNSILSTVTGTFASTTVSPPNFFTTNSPWVTNPHLVYYPERVDLVLDAAPLTPFLPANAPQNPRNVAGGIDRAYLGGATLPTAFQDLYFLPPETLQAALTSLSGEVRAHASQAGIRLMSPFLSIMLDPFVDNRLGAVGGGFGPAAGFAAEERLPPEAAAAYAAVSPKGKDALAQASPFDRRWGTWASAFGGHNKINGDAAVVGSGDMSMRANGLASGLDYRMSPDTVVGFALAGGRTAWMLADGMSGGRSEALQAGLYASHRNGGAYVSSALAYAWHRMSTDRLVLIGGVSRLGAEFSGHSLGGRIETGRRFAAANIGFTPYAALQIQAFNLPAYSEIATQGLSTFALSYDQRMTMAMRTELGAGFDKIDSYSMGQVTIRGRLAWAHDHNSEPSVTAAFQALPGSSFTVNGAKPPSDLILASMGMEVRTPRGVSFGAKVDGEFGRGLQTVTGMGSLRYAW